LAGNGSQPDASGIQSPRLPRQQDRSLPTDAKALQHLEPGQAMPMRALAARVPANPSNVTVIVSRLEARGLLSREVSADRRVKGVRLTRAGVALRARLATRLLANHPAVAGLSSDEQRSLDLGATWKQLDVEIAEECPAVDVPRVTDIAIDPLEPTRVWASAEPHTWGAIGKPCA
jgi:DNA-binding MarR family transcriptional regulator